MDKLLLPAPDKSRYVFYNKTPKRTANVNMQFGFNIPPGITEEQERAMSIALMEEHFLYFEEKVRKFWEDMNGMNV